MKYLIFLTFAFVFNFTLPKTDDVYICDSSGGKKYHYTKICRGLSNCKHEIKKMSLQKAKNAGKTLCGWED